MKIVDKIIDRLEAFIFFSTAVVVSHAFVVGMILLVLYVVSNDFDFEKIVNLDNFLKWYLYPVLNMIGVSFIQSLIFSSVFAPFTVIIAFIVFGAINKYFFGYVFWFDMFYYPQIWGKDNFFYVVVASVWAYYIYLIYLVYGSIKMELTDTTATPVYPYDD
jgi:ABC-type transporter Mla maintaining outer membrane lipid asymmetry permease subunit MlaE